MTKKHFVVFIIFILSVVLMFSTASCIRENSIKLSGISSLTVLINEEIDLHLKSTSNSSYTKEEVLSNIEYTSSNEDVVIIEDGIIKSVGYGEAIVRATWTENKSVYFESKITVISTKIEGTLIKEPETKELSIGETLQLETDFTCYYETKVVWLSSDDTIATVVDGLVATLKAGTFTIIAKFSNENETLEKSIDFSVVAKTFSITYELDGGINNSNNPSTYTEQTTTVLHEPTKEGYSFIGWYLNDDLITEIDSTTTGDITIVAKWEYIPKVYAITYVLDGGTNNPSNPSTYTEQITTTLFEPTKEGYNFIGWYLNKELITEIASTTTGNITIVAKWEYLPKVYTIAYELDGGINNSSNTSTYTEQTTTLLLAPTKEGYNFIGWYLNNELITEIDSTTTGDITIVAKWEYIPKVYSITYELNGGTNNSNNSSTYTEQTTTVLHEPTKEGYNFVGWYLNNELITEIDSTITGDITVVAKWEYIPKVYSITYELDGGINNSNNPSTYTEQTTTVLHEPTKEGYSFISWYINNDLITEIDSTTTGNITLVAKWEYIPKVYSITYDLDGGINNPNNPSTYTEQTTTTLLEPTKEGYTFIGWYLNNELITEIDSTVTGDLTIVAKWEYVPKVYSITYVLDGGTNNSNNPSTYTEQITTTLFEPTKDGYNFIGWYLNKELITEIASTTTGDITIVAKWEYVPKVYSITYVLDGGINNSNNPSTYTEQTSTILLEPTKDAYTFIGWYLNNELITEIDSTTTGNITLVAKWEYIPKVYSITYELNGGTNNSNNPSTYTEQTTTSLHEPTKDGYIFIGWYLNNELITEIDITTTGNITIVAKWEYIPKVYSITYDLDGGINNPSNPSTYTEQTTTTLLEPTKEGYIFIGWYIDNELITEIDSTTTGNITVVAKWEIKYTEVTYNLNGGEWSWTTGTVSNPALGIDGVSNLPEVLMGDVYYYLKTNNLLQSSIVSPSLSSKGYFWSEFSKNYGDPVALYNWTSTGSYNSNDGYSQLFYDTYDGINVVGGFFGTSPYKEKYKNLFEFIVQLTKIKYSDSDISENTFKSKIGFVLDGYLYGTQGLLKSGADFETFNSMRALIPTPTISYVGTQMVVNDYVITKAQGIINLVSPTREGYVFMGWYDNEELTGEPLTSVAASTTLYAKWYDLNPVHTISYQLNGGINPSDAPNTYTNGTGLFSLPIPTRDGHIFLGWSDGALSNNYITNISKYEERDFVLVANWEEILELEITYIYEEGHTPVQHAQSLTEFTNFFWQEFYAWSNSTESFESFKDSALSVWKTGVDGGYNVYKKGGRNEADDNYFVNANGNELWRNWFDVFETVVIDINSIQTAWGDYYVGYIRLYAYFSGATSTYWTADRIKTVYEGYRVSENLVTSFRTDEVKTLVGLEVDDGRAFLGWYDENDQKVTTTEGLRNNITLTAKWSEKPVLFEIKNIPERVLRFESYQLTWKINFGNETTQKLKFTSSDSNVLTVDENGLLYGVNYGNATITASLSNNSEYYDYTFDVLVYVEPFIDANYEDSSIVEIGQTTKINANIVSGNGTIRYVSNNIGVATVDENGVVTGISRGYAEITIYLEENFNTKLALGVTVVDDDMLSVFEVIRKAHNTDIHVMRDLYVAYTYYYDVFNSVSDLLFNYDYSVNESLLIPVSSSSKETARPGTKIGTMEFITVHYTAGTGRYFDAKGTAEYFNSISTASANYCTGNDGIYMTIPDGEVSWHAGDGTGVKFTWKNTGVMATGNVKPVWGVQKNSKSSTGYYFTLNGELSTVEVPISNGTSTIKDPANAFTFFGPAWKVVDGYYYMGTTWACFTQVASGVIGSRGGNLNSVGIETACNKGSDLWLTYQITAQLVARLLTKYNLDTTRVVGHNMFTGKDCPQTLLANDGELWYKFMECVESEYALYKLGNDYTITCESNNKDIVADNGRILMIPDFTTTVSYTVTVTNKTTHESKSETYSTIVHGRYTE